MKFFDLYAGIGGFRLAMESFGHECIGSCEIDKHARETYKKGFGYYPEYNDATKLNPKELPDFDCLCAGFPCQSFSIAGKRRGLTDTKGTLFFEIIRIAREKQPKLLFLENVKGLLSHEQGRTFKTMLASLNEVGYDVEWQVINGKYFLPQNRERIFIIGHLRGTGGRKIFPLGEDKTKNTKKSEKKRKSKKRVQTEICSCLDTKYSQRFNNETYLMLTERRTLHAKKIRKKMMKNGKDFCSRRDKELVTRKDNLSNCLTATQDMEHFLTDGGTKIRKLTPIECERLQGFPDNWTLGVSDVQRYKQCGNAVMVLNVKYIVQHF